MFAQLMREMLTDQSFESFRAYSLDTIARLDEALSVTEDVRRDRLPRQAVDPVQAELAWSLMKDPIAADLVHLEIYAFSDILKNANATIDDIANYLRYMQNRLGKNYKRLCEEKLIFLMSQENRRIDFRHAAGFYCSHLLNLGYSKDYITHCVEGTFFESPVHRVGRRTLSKFFRNFDSGEKEFVVCAAVETAFGKYLKRLNFDVYESVGVLPERFRNDISNLLLYKDPRAYMFYKPDARDENSAVAVVEAVLESVRALAFVVPHNMSCTWDKAMYVTRARSTRKVVIRGQALPLERALTPPSATRTAFKSLTSYSGRVLSNFNEDSTERILGSLNTSALARTSLNIENQLISLWSAVEVLLSEPPRGVPRIVHYVKLLAPCICLRYVRRQTIAIFNEMLIIYRKKFSRIVNEETTFVGNDQHTKFAAILYLPHNDALRKRLVTLCSDNPLALHRLWKLKRDYSSPKSIKSALRAHQQRVEWQLYRIYRARNNLVHAGMKPNYLDSLVINLDEYYRACLGALVNRATREETFSEIDQLVAEIGIEYRVYIDYLDSRKADKVLENKAFVRALM